MLKLAYIVKGENSLSSIGYLNQSNLFWFDYLKYLSI